MQRIVEPELMEDVDQAEAYASADFSQPHTHFIKLFGEKFPNASVAGSVLDLGCGPGDITFRFAHAYPEAHLLGVDGSQAMLDLAHKRLEIEGLTTRVRFITAIIPNVEMPKVHYAAIISNSILHQLHEPSVLWETITRYGSSGTKIFIMDLMRPSSKEGAQKMVDHYTSGEPEILRRDFYNSLLAAFTLDEVRGQLEKANLSKLKVEAVSDRHLLVHGIL